MNLIEKDLEQKTNIPSVKVLLGTHPELRTGENLSIAEANALFQKIDLESLDSFKTRFEIQCVYNNQDFTYSGRQDLGDGDGGLINHIATHADNENPFSSLKGTERDSKINDFVDYLKQHVSLEQIKDSATVEINQMELILKNSTEPGKVEHAQQQLNYNKAILEYVSDSQDRLNNGQSIDKAPVKEDFIISSKIAPGKNLTHETKSKDSAKSEAKQDVFSLKGIKEIDTKIKAQQAQVESKNKDHSR